MIGPGGGSQQVRARIGARSCLGAEIRRGLRGTAQSAGSGVTDNERTLGLRDVMPGLRRFFRDARAMGDFGHGGLDDGRYRGGRSRPGLARGSSRRAEVGNEREGTATTFKLVQLPGTQCNVQIKVIDRVGVIDATRVGVK